MNCLYCQKELFNLNFLFLTAFILPKRSISMIYLDLINFSLLLQIILI